MLRSKIATESIKLPTMRKLKLQELNRLNVEEYQMTRKIPLVLVLDNIRSMQNVGSLFRTADGFAVEKIVLCGITAKPPHRDIQRAALGATESVEWIYSEDAAEACSSLKNEGYQILPRYMPDIVEYVPVTAELILTGVVDPQPGAAHPPRCASPRPCSPRRCVARPGG